MKFSREVSSHQVRKASEVVKVPGWEAKGFPLSFAIKAGVLSRSELGMLLFFVAFCHEAGSIVYVSGMQGMDMKKMKTAP